MTTYQHNEITLTSDTVLFAMVYSELCVLTIRRDKKPFEGHRTLPGGYVRFGETSKQSAQRVLLEKASIEVDYIEQLYTFDSLDRDPRGNFTSISYLSTAHLDNLQVKKLDTKIQFTPTYTPLGFDHNDIVDYAVERLRNKLEYTSIVSSLLPKEFTLSELQSYYEIIQNKSIDKRNFRKKFLTLNLLEETGNMQKGLKQRPAKLYKFISKKISDINRW